MVRALVIASFGTSVPAARAGITAVERALSDAAPGFRWVRAFTSPAVRRILAERGEEIPSLSQALERLREEGVGQVVVQPTHLLRGDEYRRLRAEAEALAGGFRLLTVGRPLLADSGDIPRFARRLCAACPEADGEAAVFMGHGTGGAADLVYPALQDAIEREGREDLCVGAMRGRPGLEDILGWLERSGRSRVTLWPLMLTAGSHAQNDMAGIWKRHLEQAGYAAACSFTGLGELPWVQEMYRERLVHVLDRIGAP